MEARGDAIGPYKDLAGADQSTWATCRSEAAAPPTRLELSPGHVMPTSAHVLYDSTSFLSGQQPQPYLSLPIAIESCVTSLTA